MNFTYHFHSETK